MKPGFPVEQTINTRTSVRNYSTQAVEPGVRGQVEAYVAGLQNPFGSTVCFHFLDSRALEGQQKLGTYGVIKGARQYIGATISREPVALLALGYEFEALVLYLAHIGLGTCWLGGTFARKDFARAMKLPEEALFPILTPYGYAAPKKHLTETLMRKMIHADQRKPWETLFFRDNFQTPLLEKEAGVFAFPLEMVRLGPSASNKQPWRILVKGQFCHFYEHKEPGYSAAFSYDIQRVDMGIAAAHFDFATQENGLDGQFVTNSAPDVAVPANMEYVFSWVSATDTPSSHGSM